mmetsp:Transcript_95761/g.259972  ORF Transcript_95761/g.259972 Transcript_95761/m.259972 type:complete len:427 (+) Transcript_95761:1393-2673(+)
MDPRGRAAPQRARRRRGRPDGLELLPGRAEPRLAQPRRAARGGRCACRWHWRHELRLEARAPRDVPVRLLPAVASTATPVRRRPARLVQVKDNRPVVARGCAGRPRRDQPQRSCRAAVQARRPVGCGRQPHHSANRRAGRGQLRRQPHRDPAAGRCDGRRAGARAAGPRAGRGPAHAAEAGPSSPPAAADAAGGAEPRRVLRRAAAGAARHPAGGPDPRGFRGEWHRGGVQGRRHALRRRRVANIQLAVAMQEHRDHGDRSAGASPDPGRGRGGQRDLSRQRGARADLRRRDSPHIQLLGGLVGVVFQQHREAARLRAGALGHHPGAAQGPDPSREVRAWDDHERRCGQDRQGGDGRHGGGVRAAQEQRAAAARQGDGLPRLGRGLPGVPGCAGGLGLPGALLGLCHRHLPARGQPGADAGEAARG